MSHAAAVVRQLLKDAPALQGAVVVRVVEVAQLWAGYGCIAEVELKTAQGETLHLILKLVRPPQPARDQDGDGAVDDVKEGDLRKLLSFRVEANWYASSLAASLRASSVSSPHVGIATSWATQHASLPYVRAVDVDEETADASSAQAMLLDDVRHMGFPFLAEQARDTLTDEQTKAALRWLAHFHAHFVGYAPGKPSDECPPPLEVARATAAASAGAARVKGTPRGEQSGWNGRGVWQIGSYTYVATRLDELRAIPDDSFWAQLGLKGELAHAVDWALGPDVEPEPGGEAEGVPRAGQTLLHGDVKAANLAFNAEGTHAAAYDFQFVGRGLGVSDLAKFLTTSLGRRALHGDGERALLEYYYSHFRDALKAEPAPAWTSEISTEPGASFTRDQALEARRRSAAASTFEHLWADWELAIVSWQRFQAGWGAWGNVRWTEARAREILERPGWSDALLQRYRSRRRPS